MRRFMDLWWEGQYEDRKSKWAKPVYDEPDDEPCPDEPILAVTFRDGIAEYLKERGVKTDDVEAFLAAARSRGAGEGPRK